MLDGEVEAIQVISLDSVDLFYQCVESHQNADLHFMVQEIIRSFKKLSPTCCFSRSYWKTRSKYNM